MVEWSFGLLEPLDRLVLCRLAAFAGGFSVSLAESVVADEHAPRPRIAAVLAVLVDRSLVVRHGPRRYRLLETVRALAGERLAASPDAAGTYRRHAAAMVAEADRLDLAMHGPDQAAADARSTPCCPICGGPGSPGTRTCWSGWPHRCTGTAITASSTRCWPGVTTRLQSRASPAAGPRPPPPPTGAR